MGTQIRPKIIPRTHPIETEKYCIETPAIKKLQQIVWKMYENRMTGCMIYGLQRTGKTYAIENLCEYLKSKLGEEFPVYNIPEFTTNPSEKKFFSYVLYQLEHAMSKDGVTALEKRLRTNELLFEKAEKHGAYRVVLFIDEAQKLGELQFQWLKDIHSLLEKEGVFTTIFVVGQPELLYLKNSFVKTARFEIVARFMAHATIFRGIRSQEEMEICLQYYDQQTEHPPGSGWSFTHYYFPEAFEKGWRMQNHAEQLWDAFITLGKNKNLPIKKEIPFEYIAKAVQHLFKRFTTRDEKFDGFHGKSYEWAVKASGYLAVGRYIVPPKIT